jgi:putative oxidoreductase
LKRAVIDRAKRLLRAGPSTGRPADFALATRVVGGVIFVVFGFGKFVNHTTEVDSFRDYGLPSPDAFVYAIGVIEIVGGLLLVLGLLTRLAALVLAGDMVGAIIASGINKGEPISLSLAPAELLACLYLLWIGPGSRALDRRVGGS